MVLSPRNQGIFQNTALVVLFMLLLLGVIFLSVMSWVRIIALMYNAEGLTESRMEMRSDRMINLTLYD